MAHYHLARVFDGSSYANASEYLVLIEVAYHADRKGEVRVSQAEIAVHAHLSRRTVAQAFSRFQDLALLERTGHGRYRLNPTLMTTDLGALLTTGEATDDGGADPASADVEYERLKSLQGPSQGIVFSRDGWPQLVDL